MKNKSSSLILLGALFCAQLNAQNPPVVTIAEYTDGQTVSLEDMPLSITVTATDLDPDGIDWLRLKIDGVGTKQFVETTPTNPFELVFEDVYLTEGQHTLSARAGDVSGLRSSLVNIQLNVVDVLPPAVAEITNLQDGETILAGYARDYSIEASHSQGIEFVRLIVTGGERFDSPRMYEPPYLCEVPPLTEGNHRFRLRVKPFGQPSSFHDINVTAASEVPATQPNIVFILADDLGYQDLAAYGHPYILSPALDKLARDGIAFTDYYSTGATCGPSRVGLVSGKYDVRYPLDPSSHDVTLMGQPTFFNLLKSVGYRTAHVGKWHIGDNAVIDDATSQNTYDVDYRKEVGADRDSLFGRDYVTNENAIGFLEDYKANHQGTPFVLNLWYRATHSPISGQPSFEAMYDGPGAFNVEDYASGLTVEERAEIQEYFDEMIVNDPQYGVAFTSPVISDFGLDSSAAEQMNAYHLDYLTRSGADLDLDFKNYMADVTQLDFHIWRILKYIDDPANGMADNTIVVFTSDNGPAKQNRPDAEKLLGSPGNGRGRKHSLHDGGTRLPFIVRWPEKAAASSVNTDTVLTGVDFLPTLAELGGVDAADIQADWPMYIEDGQSQAKAFMGYKTVRSKTSFWTTPISDRDGVRRGGRTALAYRDGWKLYADPDSALWFAENNFDPSLIDSSWVELYPHEAVNYEFTDSDDLGVPYVDQNPQLTLELLTELSMWVDSLPIQTKP